MRGAYVLRACQEIWRYQVPHLSVSVDGKLIEQAILGIIIGKGKYFAGPFCIFPEANLETPSLNVSIILGDQKKQLFSFAMSLITGKDI